MVEYIRGSRELISYGAESGYGNPVAPTQLLGVNAVVSPTNENDWQEIPGSGADNINVPAEIGIKLIKGNLTFTPQDWKFWQFITGAVSEGGGGGPSYTHTYTPANSINSFTLERAIQHTTDRVRTYEGCKVERATLSWNIQGGAGGRGQLLNLSVDFIAQDVINATSTTSLNAPSTAGFQARHVLLTLNSSAVAQVVSGTISCINNLHDSRYANYSSVARLVSEMQPQTRRWEGEFVLHYDDDTYFDFWDNAVVVPGTNTIEFQVASDNKAIGTFTNLAIISSSDPTNLDGINQVTLRWRAETVVFVATDTNANHDVT